MLPSQALKSATAFRTHAVAGIVQAVGIDRPEISGDGNGCVTQRGGHHGHE